MLAKQFSELEGRAVSAGEVFDKISKRLVPFEMVAKVFKDLTSEGGKFYQMQEVQAETLKGKLSNLKDAYQIMFNEIGTNMEPTLKKGVDILRDMAANYEYIGKSILELVAVYGTYRAAVVITKVASRDLAVTTRFLEMNIKRLGRSMATIFLRNPYALIAAGATAAAYAIYKVVDAWTASSRMMQNYNRNMESMTSGIASETGMLDGLYAKLELAKKGTKEYENARSAIYSKYSEHIAALKEEGNAVDDLADLYEKLKNKIVDAAKEKFRRSAMEGADADYAAEVDRIYKLFAGTFENISVYKGYKNADARQKEALWQYITGGLSREDVKKYVPDLWASSVGWLKDEFRKMTDEYQKIVSDIGSIPDIFNKNAAITNIDQFENQGDRNYKDEVEKLQSRIALLEKMKDVYESMKPYFSDDDIRKFFDANFDFADKSLWENFDFDKQIQNLVTQLATLGEAGKRAADVMREKFATSLSKDVVEAARTAAKELVEAQKAAQTTAEQYRDFMANWVSGTDITGEGAGFRLSKIVSDYSKALDKIANKAKEARKKLYDKADAERKVGGWSALDFAHDYSDIKGREQLDTANALAEYSEKGREAIKKMYEEWRNGAMDFNNLSDKTLGQLKGMRDLVEGFSTDNADIFSPEVLANLETLGIDLAKLQKIINALKQSDTNKLGIEIKKETIAKWQAIVSEISNAAGAVKEYAEAAGNDGLAAAMRGIIDIADIASGVLSRLAQGDVIGAVMSGVSTLFQKVMDSFTAAARLNAAIAAAADEAERFNAEMKLSQGVDTLWGENVVAKIRNATDVMKDYASAYAKIGRDFSTKTITWRSGLFRWGSSSKSLQNALAEMGYELYDLEGRINTQGLQKILDTYEELFDADRRWIENAIRNADIYNEAVEKLNETVSDTWGSIADDMADKLIAARNEVGDAYHALAGDLQQTFGDMAQDIAKELVSSFIASDLEERFSGRLRAIYEAFGATGDEQSYIQSIAELASDIKDVSGAYAKYTNDVMGAMESAGVNFNEGSQNLSEGIKGITEDTANLLASYLNAVRADVATGNMQRNEILSVLRGITVMPNIDDYLNRIQANTYDTAQNTRDLLLDIRSMMTTETGQVALRVLS